MTGLRPLGVTREILESIGMQISYAYDDLVFVDHTAFLIQFDDENPQNLKLYFNVECAIEAAKRLEAGLTDAAMNKNFTVSNCGKFELKQKDGVEEFEIRFITG